MEIVGLMQFLQGLAFVIQTGLAGVILLIWRAEQRKNQELVQMLRETYRHLEEALQLQKDTARKLCESFERFDTLISLNVASLSRIEQKIVDGIHCPIIRKGGLFYAGRDPGASGQEGRSEEGA